MQDRYVIMTQGFRNVADGEGNLVGYQVKIRIPYYRGTFLSLIHSLSLRVDSEDVPASLMKISVADKVFGMDEMLEADDVRWDFREPATLIVSKKGGLKPGLHEISVGIVVRKSYLPPEDPERLYDFFDLWKDGKYKTFIEAPTVITKKATLVQ